MHATILPKIETQSREPQPALRLLRNAPLYASEASLASLLSSLRSSGGVLAGDRLVLLLRDFHPQPISWLARAIVKRELVHITWRSQVLVPMFQFKLEDMSVREGISDVLATLVSIYDDWELAHWFAEPNEWLHGRSPAELIGLDARGVHDAARADRFVGGGH